MNWKANKLSLREVVVIHELLLEIEYVCLHEMYYLLATMI